MFFSAGKIIKLKICCKRDEYVFEIYLFVVLYDM